MAGRCRSREGGRQPTGTSLGRGLRDQLAELSSAAGQRRKTDSVNVSPAPSYLQRFYRETGLIPALPGRRRAAMCLSLAISRACKAPAVPPSGSYTALGGFNALPAV